MSIQFQLRRGTTAQINATTPAAGEILYDTSRHTVVVGDGAQAGGYPFPSLTSAGWVGIGISPATSPLHAAVTFSSDPASETIGINSAFSWAFTLDNSNRLNGSVINIGNISLTVGKTLSGVVSGQRIDGFINNAAFAGTASSQYGSWTRVGFVAAASGAIITAARGQYIEISNQAAGTTISTAYGLYVQMTGSSGTITNLYDIYCADTTAKNYFAGQIYAGTGGASAPAYAFNADSNTGMFDVSADIIGWACGGTEMARLNGSGHFLIGTTVDNGHLTVGGKIMPEADNTRDMGSATFRWANGYIAQLIATKARITTSQTPATSGAAGTQGDFAWDASYFYICTATNTWHRVAHATW